MNSKFVLLVLHLPVFLLPIKRFLSSFQYIPGFVNALKYSTINSSYYYSVKGHQDKKFYNLH